MFKPGRNVWRTAHAERATPLVDADAFFKAFVGAASCAQKSIFILGWDFDTRTEMPLEADDPRDRRLGRFLCRLITERPDLQIYVLTWNFAFIYVFERESFPSAKFRRLNLLSPRKNDLGRLRFKLDRSHPTMASHHQKVVVIDDEIAFSGGLDLTQRRWDTPEHSAHDDRRVDPGGHCYGPFHDVQMCVEGEAARALGEIARERWERATGETLPLRGATKKPSEAWPKDLSADFRNVEIGIARTLPIGYRENEASKPVVEVERLFLDAIRSAQRFVYIENQYFTSVPIAKAIARRLKEENGPEFVMVLPRDQTGWIEEKTMGRLRSQALRIVEEADRFGRFRCFHPIVAGLTDGYVKVHSKVMIVDDSHLRIGSANLNNRSMGLDTECDLAIEACDRPDVRVSIASLRRRLLGEHLGVDPAEFEARFLTNGSLVDTVESFRGRERTLIEIRPQASEEVGFYPPGEWIDPSGPRGIRRWLRKRVFFMSRRLTLALVAIVVAAFFVFLYQAGGLADYVAWVKSWNPERVAGVVRELRESPFALPLILAGFVIGSLLFIPVMGMMLGVVLAFPAGVAPFIAIAGAMTAAMGAYGAGRIFAWRESRLLERPALKKLSVALGRGGIPAVLFARLTPVAPFTIVGIACGSLRIRLRDYVVGTFIGLTPGFVMITLVAYGSIDFRQGWASVLWLLCVLSVLSLVFARLRARTTRAAGTEAS